MTSQARVLLTHKIPEAGLNLLRDEIEVLILDDKSPIDSQLQKLLSSVDYLVPLLSVNINEELMDLAPSLRGISNYAVGYNNIDIAAAKKRNILVTNTPGVLTDATADLVWGLIFAITRRIVEGDKICRADAFSGWLPEYLLGFEITGKTLGIIGLGRIGTAVAKRAIGFDMRVLYHSRTRKYGIEEQNGLIFRESLNEVLKEADIISLNVPYTSETHHLISKQELSLMKSSAYLINTSRGRVINERDLIIALRKKVIAGAGLDVFYDEPSIPQELRDLHNVVLTPHIGSATTQARNAMARMVAENILAIERGEQPPNIIPEMRQKEKMGKE